MIKVTCVKCGKELKYNNFWKKKEVGWDKIKMHMEDEFKVVTIAGKKEVLCTECYAEYQEARKDWEKEWIKEGK